MKKAKDALCLFIRSLPDGAKYSIISFGTDYEIMKRKGKDVIECCEENNYMVLQTIESEFHADLGGTNILDPLNKSFDIDTSEYGPLKTRVFILTDGQVDNPQQVINAAKNDAAIVHTFGIGSGCDAHLVHETAKSGRGSSSIV